MTSNNQHRQPPSIREELNKSMDIFEKWGKYLEQLGRLNQPDIEVTSTHEGTEKGILSLTVRPDPFIFFGMSAGKLRDLGWAHAPDEDSIPDCAVFGPNGFEWYQVDVDSKIPTTDQHTAP